MVQQKRLHITALKANAHKAAGSNDESVLTTMTGSNEIVKILEKDVEQALAQLQEAETHLTQTLIGSLGEEHMETKVAYLQKLALKLTELKRSLVCKPR